MDQTFEVLLKGHRNTLFIGISGVVGNEELHLLENVLLEIEKTIDKNTFVFDFSRLEEISIVAISVIVLMQIEARKRGQVHTIAPSNELKTVFINSGAVRETELMPIQKFDFLNANSKNKAVV